GCAESHRASSEILCVGARRCCTGSGKRAPHPPQNRESGAFSVPQLGQRIPSARVAHLELVGSISPTGSSRGLWYPRSRAMSQILDRVLTAARQLGASDVHLKAGLPPIFRIKGELRTVRDVPALTREAIAQFAVHMMNDRQRADFEQHLDIDLAYGTPDGVRYRANLFQQRGSVGIVLRLIPPEVPPFDRLNLPQAVLDLANNTRGIVLVTGATGSGKSTTLAAMIDYINTQHAYHIVTVEDPIEYTFRDKRSVLNQRELGFDTMSFSR